MRGRAISTGALTGACLGLLTLLALAGLAPGFFEPLTAAVAATLALHTVLGVFVGLAVSGATVCARARCSTPAAAGVTFVVYGAVAGGMLALYACPMPSGLLALVGTVLGAGYFALAFFALRRRRVLGIALLAAAGVSAVVLPGQLLEERRQPTPAPEIAHVLVVGLDGGTWRVLAPLLRSGELPAIARVIEEGTSGPLWSIERSFSPVVWTSIATGKRAEKHGIQGFYDTQNANLRAARFWEVSAARGLPVGIFQWLVTWPPDSLPGFVVPAWLARDSRTVPERLRFLKELELARQENRPLGPLAMAHIGIHSLREGLRFGTIVEIVEQAWRGWRSGGELALYRAGKMIQLALNEDVFVENYRRLRPPVGTATFYGSDALSHLFWKYHEPEAFDDVASVDVVRFGDTIRDFYRRFDRTVERLLGAIDERTILLIVSDHGSKAGEHRGGYALKTRDLLSAIGEEDTFQAYGIGNRVFLMHRGDPAHARETMHRAAAKLESLKLDGQRLLQVEVSDDGLSATFATGNSLFRPGASIDTPTGQRPLSEIVTAVKWSGCHDQQGILLVRGPGIRRGHRIENASLVDVAPTILHLLGEPVAEDMDGRVLTEMLTLDRPVKTVASYDDVVPVRAAQPEPAGDVEDRLRALGYVR